MYLTGLLAQAVEDGKFKHISPIVDGLMDKLKELNPAAAKVAAETKEPKVQEVFIEPVDQHIYSKLLRIISQLINNHWHGHTTVYHHYITAFYYLNLLKESAFNKQ